MSETGYIERFLRDRYSDEQLAALLAHAQDGKLKYASCCCLIGFINADHPYASDIATGIPYGETHYMRIKQEAYNSFPIAQWNFFHPTFRAENEFKNMATNDEERRKLLIPLIIKEQERREMERKEKEQPNWGDVHIKVHFDNAETSAQK